VRRHEKPVTKTIQYSKPTNKRKTKIGIEEPERKYEDTASAQHIMVGREPASRHSHGAGGVEKNEEEKENISTNQRRKRMKKKIKATSQSKAKPKIAKAK